MRPFDRVDLRPDVGSGGALPGCRSHRARDPADAYRIPAARRDPARRSPQLATAFPDSSRGRYMEPSRPPAQESPSPAPHSHIGCPSSSRRAPKPPHEPLMARLPSMTPTAMAEITRVKTTRAERNVSIDLTCGGGTHAAFPPGQLPARVGQIRFSGAQPLLRNRNRRSGSFLLRRPDHRTCAAPPATSSAGRTGSTRRLREPGVCSGIP